MLAFTTNLLLSLPTLHTLMQNYTQINRVSQKKKKKNAIIGWVLYFKNKKNLEQIMSISK